MLCNHTTVPSSLQTPVEWSPRSLVDLAQELATRSRTDEQLPSQALSRFKYMHITSVFFFLVRRRVPHEHSIQTGAAARLSTSFSNSMDNKERKQANLKVLRRQDSSIQDILDVASHVVVYVFDASSQKWVRVSKACIYR